MAGNPHLWSKTAADNDDADATVNWLEGQLPSTVNNSARAMMASWASWRDDNNGTLSTAGSSNTYTIAAPNVSYTLINGLTISARANHSNTGAATLNVNSLGAKAIRGPGDVALTANQIISGSHYVFQYNSSANGAAGAWMVLNATTPLTIASGAISPVTTDTLALGTSSLMWSDLFLASGAVVNFNNGNVTVTHTAGSLIISGSAGGSISFDTVETGLIFAGGGRMYDQTSTQRTIISANGDRLDLLNEAGSAIVGSFSTGGMHFTTANANGFALGRQGTTDPALKVDTSAASSATGVEVVSAAAAGGVALRAISSGADENLTIDAKGAGTVTINGTATGNITLSRAVTASLGFTMSAGDITFSTVEKGVVFSSGGKMYDQTSTQRTIIHSNGNRLDVLDEAGTGIMLSFTDGVLGHDGTGVEVEGTNTNDSAAAGYVGECIESEILSGSAVSLTTGTGANVTSISLTAGDWDVWGSVIFAAASGTTSSVHIAAVNTTSATAPTPPNKGGYTNLTTTFTTGVQTSSQSAGHRRYSMASTTTVYLIAQASFATSTMTAYGYIGARRVR